MSEEFHEAVELINGVDPTNVRPQKEARKLVAAGLLLGWRAVILKPGIDDEEEWARILARSVDAAHCYYDGHEHITGRELAQWRFRADFFKGGGELGARLLNSLRCFLGAAVIIDQRAAVEVLEERPAPDVWVLVVNGVHNLSVVDRYPFSGDEQTDAALHWIEPDEEIASRAKGQKLLVLAHQANVHGSQN